MKNVVCSLSARSIMHVAGNGEFRSPWRSSKFLDPSFASSYSFWFCPTSPTATAGWLILHISADSVDPSAFCLLSPTPQVVASQAISCCLTLPWGSQILSRFFFFKYNMMNQILIYFYHNRFLVIFVPLIWTCTLELRSFSASPTWFSNPSIIMIMMTE